MDFNPPSPEKMRSKKSVINQIMFVGIAVLVISVLFGLTFLFVSSLKDTSRTMVETTEVVGNETPAYINETGYTLAGASDSLARSYAITAAYNITNVSGWTSIPLGNITVSEAGVVTNATTYTWANVTIDYTYKTASSQKGWLSINETEKSGYLIVSYLPIVFLAIIFGAIMVVLFKIILPTMSETKSLNNGF